VTRLLCTAMTPAQLMGDERFTRRTCGMHRGLLRRLRHAAAEGLLLEACTDLSSTLAERLQCAVSVQVAPPIGPPLASAGEQEPLVAIWLLLDPLDVDSKQTTFARAEGCAHMDALYKWPGPGRSGTEAEGPDALLALNPFDLGSFSEEKTRYMARFDVERWVRAVGSSTFETAWDSVSWAEGGALVSWCQQYTCGHRDKLTSADEVAMASLLSKIQGLMAAMPPVGQSCAGSGGGGGGEGGFFVRLGPRSPKDAPTRASTYEGDPAGIPECRIRAALEAAATEQPLTRPSPREVLHLFQTACYRLLRVDTAEEALRLLGSSARVLADVSHTRDHGEPGWQMSLVCRRWDSRVTLEREFRVFVVAGHATAITQYDDQLSHAFVRDNGEAIVATVLAGLAAIRPGLAAAGLAGTALIADFALCGTSASLEARLIELNPFGPVTGASLFCWHGERRLLQGGRDLYGDLSEWEGCHPPRSAAQDPVAEEVIRGVPFRWLKDHPPGLSWEHLEIMWPDFARLAPAWKQWSSSA